MGIMATNELKVIFFRLNLDLARTVWLNLKSLRIMSK